MRVGGSVAGPSDGQTGLPCAVDLVSIGVLEWVWKQIPDDDNESMQDDLAVLRRGGEVEYPGEFCNYVVELLQEYVNFEPRKK